VQAEFSAQAEEGKNGHDHHNQSDQINETVHRRLHERWARLARARDRPITERQVRPKVPFLPVN
jgi:hypothetical protein